MAICPQNKPQLEQCPQRAMEVALPYVTPEPPVFINSLGEVQVPASNWQEIAGGAVPSEPCLELCELKLHAMCLEGRLWSQPLFLSLKIKVFPLLGWG